LKGGYKLKKARTFTLEEKLLDLLKEESDKTGVPQARIVGWALASYLSVKQEVNRNEK
jgi:hypothetical protein